MDTTLSVDAPFGIPRPADPVWGLCIAWSLEEPRRVGQTFLLQSSRGELGRGPGDGTCVRLGPAWVRGASVHAQPHLTTRRLSRRQLVLHDGPRLGLENTGKTKLLVHGQPVERVELDAGDVVELDNTLVLIAVRRALSVEASAWSFPPGSPDPFGMIGETDGIWAVRTRLAELRALPGHVLVTGPSGAGKELAARALRMEPRAWVARNAATIPESLAAAELFGNRRDYPNAGMPDRAGLVGEADGGVLYLDEIGELPVPVQTALLRVLDDGEYQRVGEARTRRTHLRVVGATNQPLENLRPELVARFRHVVTVPGLDDRLSDVPLLLDHLLRQARREGAPDRFFDPEPRISPRFVRWLLERSWSTHARELDQLVWEALQSSPADYLDVHTPVEAAAAEVDWSPWIGSAPEAIPSAALQACLDAHNGSQEDAWRALALSSRHVLRRLITRHGLVVRRTPGRA